MDIALTVAGGLVALVIAFGAGIREGRKQLSLQVREYLMRMRPNGVLVVDDETKATMRELYAILNRELDK